MIKLFLTRSSYDIFLMISMGIGVSSSVMSELMILEVSIKRV